MLWGGKRTAGCRTLGVGKGIATGGLVGRSRSLLSGFSFDRGAQEEIDHVP
jgi:hypothetical protein